MFLATHRGTGNCNEFLLVPHQKKKKKTQTRFHILIRTTESTLSIWASYTDTVKMLLEAMNCKTGQVNSRTIVAGHSRMPANLQGIVYDRKHTHTHNAQIDVVVVSSAFRF